MIERQKDSSLHRFLFFFFFYATIIEGVLLIEYLPGDANTIDLSASREGRRIISVTD